MKSFDQWKEDKKQRDVNSAKYLFVFIIFTALTLGMLSSCATNGFGCKGTGKLITRVPQ